MSIVHQDAATGEFSSGINSRAVEISAILTDGQRLRESLSL